MDVFQAIATRRSVRKYLDRELEWDKVGYLLEAAIRAPSSGNLQNWKFIVVTEKAGRQAVAEACLQQLWMATAPVHIVICAEPQKAMQFYGVRGERLYSIQNCSAAAQNIMLTAHELGLGACWVGAFEEEMLKSAIGIPDYIRPQAVITVGYPDEVPEEPARYRIYDMVFLEKWERRIKDLSWVLHDYSVTINKKIAKGAQKLQEHGKTIAKKLHEHSKKVVEKVKAGKE